MKHKFLFLILALFALSVNARVIDLTTTGISIDEWNPGNGATLNASETDESIGKYVYDIAGGDANEAFMQEEPDVVFKTQNTSDKSRAFNIYPGNYFIFGGKNGVLVVRNTHAGDRIIIRVASKGSTAASFLDANGVYPKNAITKSLNLSLQPKEGDYQWEALEFLSLGGDVEIKEFSGGFAVRSIQIEQSETISCADAAQIGSRLDVGKQTTDSFTVVGYITSIVTAYNPTYGNMSFYMADSRGGGNQLEAYHVAVPEELVIGTKVAVRSVIKNYNGIAETYYGSLVVLEDEQSGDPDPEDPEPENPEYVPTRTGMYITGSFNNWAIDSAYEFLQAEDNTYFIKNVTISGEFYIGGQNGEFYFGSNGSRIQANTTYSLSYYGNENIRCDFASIACTKITLNPNNNTLLLQGEAQPLVYETVTVRIDPYSVDWTDLYAYVWTGGESMYDAEYQSGATRVVWAQKAQIDANGWAAVSFMLEENTTYHLSWQESSSPYTWHSSYCLTNLSGSVCTAYNNDKLQTAQCRSLLPTEENTYTIHVDIPGTFGQMMVQALGDNTWANVYELTVTGTLNAGDLQYFTRMANLQRLDLSGADMPAVGGCANLNKLNTVVLPVSCTTINDNAFSQCKRLKTINLDNIRTVGKRAFYNCRAITALNMPQVLTIGAYAFESGALVSANIPLVQRIDEAAFRSNNNLASVTMPLVTSIGRYAFERCYALTQVDIANATYIGEEAFDMEDEGRGHIAQVYLSDELEAIPHRCFYGNSNLTTITLPAALKSIDSDALPYLTEVDLPEGVTSVGSNNFNNTTSITIPAQITSWDAYSSSWEEVYCHIVAPITFSTFMRDEVVNMTLYVPAVSLAAYKLHDGWYRFGQILPMEGDVDHLMIRYSEYSLLSTTGLAEPADVTLGAEGALIVSTANPLQIGNYTQYVGGFKQYSHRYSYDDDWNEYYSYYSYMPYTGVLLANSAMTADAPVIRYVPQSDRWNFFSLPFDVNMADITIGTEGFGVAGTSQWVIREYSGANRASGNGATWNNVPANGMLHAHTGYILYWVVENGSETGDNFYYYFNMPAANNANKQNIFTTADVSVPLTEYSAEYPQNSSWNLVGNPYPCMFDSRQMDLDAPITVWNGNGYTAYSLEDDNYMLRPAEAFFVQAPLGTSAITFHKEGRSAEIYQSVSEEEVYGHYYAPRRLTNNSTRKVFNFTLSNADYTDRARLVLNENASANYELTRDAVKMMSSDNTVPQLYVNDNGLHYAIDERPDENSQYILGAFFGKAGEYTLHMTVPATEDRAIILTDTQTLISTDLREGDYTFTTEAGSFNNRFTVSFAPQMMTGVDEMNMRNVPTKTLEDGQLIITTPQGKKYTVGGMEL